MARLSTIELFREDLTFSAGHFIIFSATERSKLHGHNFQVHAAFTTFIEANGFNFDYRNYTQKLRKLCQSINGIFLLPGTSQHIQILDDEHHYYVHFNHEKIPFLKHDVLILPLSNITVEELSEWFLQQLLVDKTELSNDGIQAMTIKLSSAAGAFGSASWSKEDR